MKNFILLLFGLLMFAVAKPQYVDKASVINSINANVQRAPAVPLRGDTLNKILKGLAEFAGTLTIVTKNATSDSFIVTTNGIRTALKDSAGGGGGAPMRFGIEDGVMGENRRMSMQNNTMFYDFGTQGYLSLGGNTGNQKFDFYIQDSPYISTSKWAEIFQNTGTAALYSGIGSIGNASIYAHDSTVELASNLHETLSDFIMKGTSVTLTRSNDYIAKNIITSISNQLADINGNINTPQFTVAQRNAMPIPSAGFTAFITDAVANDGSVGVNQSWNGTMWKNNW